MMDEIEKRSRCRVCGWLFPGPVWEKYPEEPDFYEPTYDICPCCNCEVGNEDFTLESTRRYREQWLAEGMPPFLGSPPRTEKRQHAIREQMKNIPPEWL